MTILKQYNPELVSIGIGDASIDLTQYISLNKITDLS